MQKNRPPKTKASDILMQHWYLSCHWTRRFKKNSLDYSGGSEDLGGKVGEVDLLFTHYTHCSSENNHLLFDPLMQALYPNTFHRSLRSTKEDMKG